MCDFVRLISLPCYFSKITLRCRCIIHHPSQHKAYPTYFLKFFNHLFVTLGTSSHRLWTYLQTSVKLCPRFTTFLCHSCSSFFQNVASQKVKCSYNTLKFSHILTKNLNYNLYQLITSEIHSSTYIVPEHLPIPSLYVKTIKNISPFTTRAKFQFFSFALSC